MNERIKKIGLSVFFIFLVIVAVLVYFFFPLEKNISEPETRRTLVIEDARLKCDIAEIVRLGGESKTAVYTLKVEAGETIQEYVIDESYEVQKI